MIKTILIIEDNEQNLYMMRFLLESYGFSVIEARDGKEGLDLSSKTHPQAILLDIQLPGMNGYEVAIELRKNPDIASIPIIAVTSYAMLGDREKAIAAGATGYIEKPINPDIFIDQILRFVEHPET